ncbi:MAG: LCP family protein [Dehalococcoidia bacterium]|nr:LCP family protein [Dehalococcoidia bacterium]
MAGRAEEASLLLRPARSRRGAASAHSLSLGQRLLFVLALLTFGLASIYTGLAMLTRVTPQLFPGQNFTLGGALPNLSRIGITAPGVNSQVNQRINLLVIGVDKRPHYRDLDAYLTDTIMVATIDPVGKSVNILSIPRDTYITIHHPDGSKYSRRINESYGVGVTTGGSFEAGAGQLEYDLKQNFGIEIDSWVLLDFKGVEKLINAVGGVDVDIPYELSVGNWFYSDDDINGVWLTFPSGMQHLDGYHAVAFGRHREYDNDFQRVKRQQLVVQAAVQKLFARGLLNNPLDLWDAYSSTVKTDMSKAKMAGLAPLVVQTQGRMKTFSLADPVDGVPTLTPYTDAAGAAVQLYDPENVQYILGQVFSKAAYADSHVEIQNAYGDGGDARAAALGRYLAYSRGLPTVAIGPDSPRLEPVTTVTLYGEERRSMAEDIAKWIGVPVSAIRVEPRVSEALPDVVIVIGRDFKMPGG